jgi:hypothetical protein
MTSFKFCTIKDIGKKWNKTWKVVNADSQPSQKVARCRIDWWQQWEHAHLGRSLHGVGERK